MLPELAPGVLVGIHDIFLPFDYPPQWASRYYSEQYLLACYLLAQSRWLAPVLPCYYVGDTAGLRELLAPLWNHGKMRDVDSRGFTFWLTTEPR